jgi:L-malate glycosyltransferase
VGSCSDFYFDLIKLKLNSCYTVAFFLFSLMSTTIAGCAPACADSVKPPGIPVLLMARELNFGGIERDVSKFARHLGACGVEPHVACFNPGGVRWQEIEAAGIPAVRIPVTSFKSWSVVSGARTLARYVAEHRIQVIHAFDDGANVFGVAVGRMLRVPATIASQLGSRDLSRQRNRILMAMADKIASAHFVNCQATAGDLASRWHVPRSRIHVCYNGFETGEFHPHNRRRPAQFADASVVIGTVALLRAEKNLPLLIEAFARVRSVDPKARLLIVGSGPLKAELQHQTRQLDIAQSCVFEEATTTPATWMRAIDIFVLPSRSESFSNALLEAMACGCCPVGSRVGGTPELISHGERGLLFESDNVDELSDALCTLVLDPPRYQAMARAASRFAHEHLTIEIAASRLASIYTNVLMSRSS